MKLKITKPDIISTKDYNKTEIEKVFTNKETQAVAFVKKDHAVLISEDNESEDSDETK